MAGEILYWVENVFNGHLFKWQAGINTALEVTGGGGIPDSCVLVGGTIYYTFQSGGGSGVRSYNLGTGIDSLVATLGIPFDMTAAPDGSYLLVADYDGISGTNRGTIFKVALPSGTVSVFYQYPITNGTTDQWEPNGMAFDGSGNIYALADNLPGVTLLATIMNVFNTSGTLLNTYNLVDGGGFGFGYIDGLAYDSVSGHLFVGAQNLSHDTGHMAVITTAGAFVRYAGGISVNVMGVTAAGGSVYAQEATDGKVVKYNPAADTTANLATTTNGNCGFAVVSTVASINLMFDNLGSGAFISTSEAIMCQL